MKDIYNDGTYLSRNKSWHAEDSHWKACQIRKAINRNSISLSSICEVGCGAGEILLHLDAMMDQGIKYFGYDISADAYSLCIKHANQNISYYHQDLLQQVDKHYDLVLIMDVIEHVPDVYQFLREVKLRGEHKLFHIPLDLSSLALLGDADLLEKRNKVGHIHYFTKATALASLTDSGYEIVDYFYTGSSVDFHSRWKKVNLLNSIRKLVYRANRDFAVRLLGGYSLIVLAR